MSYVQSMWKGAIRTPADDIAEIIKDVAWRHGMTPELIKGTLPCRRIARARQEAMWRLRGLTRNDGTPRLSYPRIGQILNRDHSTVIFGVRAHERRACGNSSGTSCNPEGENLSA